MSVEHVARCDRCNYRLPVDQFLTWLRMVVSASEDNYLKFDCIDLCPRCEKDMALFMAGEALNRFLEEKAK